MLGSGFGNSESKSREVTVCAEIPHSRDARVKAKRHPMEITNLGEYSPQGAVLRMRNLCQRHAGVLAAIHGSQAPGPRDPLSARFEYHGGVGLLQFLQRTEPFGRASLP